jgi:2-isopropylmalate synthase
MSDQVIVFDTTLRDGEQSAGVCFTAQDKLDIARALADMHVDVIEAGFPAASVAERRAVAGVAREVRGATICALARAVPYDIDAAAEAIRGAERPRIHTFINASDVQLAHQLRKGREEVLSMVEYAVKRARNATDDVEFSPMDATRADEDFLVDVVRTALAAGATTVNIPDTVGYVLPDRLRDLIVSLRARVPELSEAVVSFHGQDDLGLATANALAAVSAGARQVELAVNGIGERAGNTAFEEVVMAIQVHGGALGVHTGVDARGICAVSALVAERSGIAVPPNKAVVGANAFRHASGIHQDGVLKWRENYEVLDPQAIGHARGTEIVLGKLSGRAGFVARARSLGFCLTDAALEQAFERFQALADRKPVVDDEDMRVICAAA